MTDKLDELLKRLCNYATEKAESLDEVWFEEFNESELSFEEAKQAILTLINQARVEGEEALLRKLMEWKFPLKETWPHGRDWFVADWVRASGQLANEPQASQKASPELNKEGL